MNLHEKTAAELSAMLAAKKISATELLNDVFDRIDSVEPKVQAYITETRELAQKQAAEADAKRAKGESLTPLAGIPVAVKDNIGVKGIPLTCASKMLEHYVTPFSATAVDALLSGGAVLTGKTNLDEFAMGSACVTSFFKKTKNPHDLEYIPGGSSGGSAAVLAAGEAVLALGSDTGGSARLPAAFCGVVALRPTYGAVSRNGLVAFASSMDQIAPMARSVTDTAMLFSSICGPDKMDATAANREYPDFAHILNDEISGKIIGVPDEYFGEAIDGEIKETVMEAIRVLEREGAKVKRISLPSTKYALPAYMNISCAEASSNLARFDGVRFGHRANEYRDADDLMERSRGEGFGDEVKRRIMAGTNILSTKYYNGYYKRACLMRRRIAAEFDTAFMNCDFVVTPTSPVKAPKLGEAVLDPDKTRELDIMTVAASLAGLPAISLPCAVSLDRLPVGLQIIGKKFDEADILKMAYRYETATGGPKPLPPISQ